MASGTAVASLSSWRHMTWSKINRFYSVMAFQWQFQVLVGIVFSAFWKNISVASLFCPIGWIGNPTPSTWLNHQGWNSFLYKASKVSFLFSYNEWVVAVLNPTMVSHPLKKEYGAQQNVASIKHPWILCLGVTQFHYGWVSRSWWWIRSH